MKQYGILTRVMLRNMLASLNPFAASYDDQRKKSRAIMRAILLCVVSLAAVGSVIYLEYLIFTGLKTIGMPKLLPGMALFVSTTFTLIMGLFQGLSELFQGKDAPFLATLPLTSRAIFSARMTTLYLSELGINTLICVPAFVFYAIGTGSAWPVALTGIPVLLLTPIIPLCIVALVASLLMRISFISRHRDTVVMILSFGIAIAYSIAVTMGNASQQSMDEMIVGLLSQEGMLGKLMGFFPPVRWATEGLTGSWGMLLLYAAVSAACVAGLVALIGPGYLAEALSSTEKTVSHRRVRGEYTWKKGGALGALHALEWKQLLRTPAWAYNALAGVVMFPLMITIGMIAGARGAGDSIEGLRQVLATVDPGYIAVVTAGVLMFGCMVNPAVSTAISREGGCWPFALTLPVKQQTRFLAKLLVGLEINVVCSALLAVVAYVLIRMNVLWLLAALAVSLLVGLASAAFSLWVDAKRPQLSWASEMEAIKKNFNQVFGMMIWVVQVALCVVPAIFLWDRGGGITLLGIAAVAVLETALSLFLLLRAVKKHQVLKG